MLEIELFWIVSPCNFVVEYEHFRCPLPLPSPCSVDLWNVGILPQHNTTQHNTTQHGVTT